MNPWALLARPERMQSRPSLKPMPHPLLESLSVPSQVAVLHCRSHRWQAEDVEPAETPDGDTVVRMACLDNDANCQRLEVFWAREVDAQVLGETTWDTMGQRGFDDRQVFCSYLNTLRGNCVTSTDLSRRKTPPTRSDQIGLSF